MILLSRIQSIVCDMIIKTKVLSLLGLNYILGGWQMDPCVSQRQCNMSWNKFGESSETVSLKFNTFHILLYFHENCKQIMF